MVVVDGLRSLRLNDLHDTGPDQHLVVEGALYRVPGRAAGLLRAAVLERHTQLAAAPSARPESALGGVELSAGPTRGTPIGSRALQQVLDRAAAHAGVTLAAPSFRPVVVHDLRRVS